MVDYLGPFRDLIKLRFPFLTLPSVASKWKFSYPEQFADLKHIKAVLLIAIGLDCTEPSSWSCLSTSDHR